MALGKSSARSYLFYYVEGKAVGIARGGGARVDEHQGTALKIERSDQAARLALNARRQAKPAEIFRPCDRKTARMVPALGPTSGVAGIVRLDAAPDPPKPAAISVSIVGGGAKAARATVQRLTLSRPELHN
ncbi:hypothetical protein [Aurantiacibacter flavus]|uniref:Uncharacterized protein n=1 Tax=Aurantiacibacter flavus TaxID=3145232 RepID=A0ABV0D2V8_9SPHN